MPLSIWMIHVCMSVESKCECQKNNYRSFIGCCAHTFTFTCICVCIFKGVQCASLSFFLSIFFMTDWQVLWLPNDGTQWVWVSCVWVHCFWSSLNAVNSVKRASCHEIVQSNTAAVPVSLLWLSIFHSSMCLSHPFNEQT